MRRDRIKPKSIEASSGFFYRNKFSKCIPLRNIELQILIKVYELIKERIKRQNKNIVCENKNGDRLVTKINKSDNWFWIQTTPIMSKNTARIPQKITICLLGRIVDTLLKKRQTKVERKHSENTLLI